MRNIALRLCVAIGACVVSSSVASAQRPPMEVRRDSALAHLKADTAGARLQLAPFKMTLDHLSIRLASIKAGSETTDPLDERYAAGGAALDKMTGAISTVSEIEVALQVEQNFAVTTNIWGDQELRHWWDQVQHWASAGGIAYAAYAMIQAGTSSNTVADQNKQMKSAGLALGVAALTNVLGNLIGPTSRERLKSKVRFIDFTRGAFDDIRVRSDLAVSYVALNDSLVRRLEQFKKDEYLTASSSDDKKKVIGELIGYLDAFDRTLEQVPHVSSPNYVALLL